MKSELHRPAFPYTEYTVARVNSFTRRDRVGMFQQRKDSFNGYYSAE